MITCPLCQKTVHIPLQDVNGALLHLQDDATDDFDCPTMVNVAPERRWSHYSRRTSQGQWPCYSIVHPPFEISWYENGRLVVERFAYKGDSSTIFTLKREILLVKEEMSFQDLFQTANRFKILVPFS